MRLLATDLDGTLLGHDGQVSERSVRALQAARDAGWYVVLATGRPPFMVDLLMPQLSSAVTHGVMANGSVVATLPDQQVMRSVRFEIGLATGVVERLRSIDPHYRFALATDAGFAHERGFADRMPAPTPTPPTIDVLEAAAGAAEAIKLMVFHDRYGAHELLGLLPTILGHDVSVTHMGADCVEVGVAGIDKATGLTFLCEQLGVDASDVVAFGDEFNDHEMLQWAGHAVAMANAHPATRDLADEVTLSNLDDGVAVVIERLLAGGTGA
jgi:Cof subfamily protein (haloacid dehalogenase superfamily)